MCVTKSKLERKNCENKRQNVEFIYKKLAENGAFVYGYRTL